VRLAAVCLGASLAPLDTSVNVAFPAITADLDQPVAEIRWVVIVYVLTYGALMLGFGRLADVVGHRRVFLAGLAWSAVAFALCAAAPDFELLLAARVGQGVGAALLLASAPALVTLSLPESRRTRGVAIYTFAFAVSNMLGPLVGGALVQRYGWPSVFWFRILVALAAIALTLYAVPPASARDPRTRADPVTGALLAAGLAAGLLALSQGGTLGWRSAETLVLAGTGLGLLVAFTHRQRTPANRIIDLRLFRVAAFARINVSHMLHNAAAFMVMLFVPFYLQRRFGAGGGMLLFLAPLGFALGSALADRALRVASARPVSVGALVLCALTLAAIAAWTPQSPAAWVGAVLLAQGLSYGLFQVAVMDTVMGTLSRAQQGVAGSLTTLTRNIGVILGASAGAALFAALEARGFELAFTRVFQAAAGLSLFTAFLMLAGSGTRSDGINRLR
jgi:MFS family permease